MICTMDGIGKGRESGQSWRESVSIELIDGEIRRFLFAPQPEVLCIRGRWGVGKTFAWNRCLREARAVKKIGLKRYSYVSLFGLTSLDDLKFSIFENTVRSEMEVKPSLETLRSNAMGVAEHLGRKAVWFAQQLPLVKNHVGGLSPVWFLSVKATIICVDDFERRGERLAVRDVLGLVSNLKEEKECKVVLILNDEALAGDKEDFEKYLEKVVDVNLTFAPSAADCARIALSTTTETNDLLRQCCVTLGISNIRVIKKIERAIGQIEPALKAFDGEVLSQAVTSLTLLGWSAFEPKLAPPLDYLEKKSADPLGIGRGETVSVQEAAWNALLAAYRWQPMDDLDRVLLHGIQSGFFNLPRLKVYASELNDKWTAVKSNSSFQNGWRMFHESFEDNQQQVLDAVYQSFLDTIRYRSALDLNGTVWLLKELGRQTEARNIIQQYIATRGADKDRFDLDRLPFKERIEDPDVILAFKDKYAEFKDERDPAITLRAIAKAQGWSGEDLDVLSKLPVDDYYKILKANKNQALLDTLEGCLQFDRIANATEPMKEISRRAKEALRRIGQESHINALRVRKYGVNADVASKNDSSRD